MSIPYELRDWHTYGLTREPWRPWLVVLPPNWGCVVTTDVHPLTFTTSSGIEVAATVEMGQAKGERLAAEYNRARAVATADALMGVFGIRRAATLDAGDGRNQP